ncbi:MAG: hypothetical protein IJU50_10530, partial [Lachnospiraceae bacterium]|nr:hypothetical protein [Lachnospiraceae bacterium]
MPANPANNRRNASLSYILFFTGLLIVLVCLYFLYELLSALTYPENNITLCWHAFYAQPAHSIDTLVLGNSHA